MRDDERAVLELLAEAAVKFSVMKRYHPDEMNEFVTAIHAAQTLVMARVAVRSNPDYFNHVGDL